MAGRVNSERLGESDLHPINRKTPDQQYQNIDRKKRKVKTGEDKNTDLAAWANKTSKFA